MTSKDDEPRFAPARRGYDRQQVDDYVARLRRYAEPRFAPARRGYDRQQVDDYVSRLRRYVDDAYNRGGAVDAEFGRRGRGERDESGAMIRPGPIPLNEPVSTASNEMDALRDSLSKILMAALKEARALRATAREEAQRIIEEARLRARHDEGARTEAEQIVVAARVEAEQTLARGREQAAQLLEQAETQAADRLAQVQHDVEQTRAYLGVLQAQVAEHRRRDEANAEVRQHHVLLRVDEADTTIPPGSRARSGPGATPSVPTHKLDVGGRTGSRPRPPGVRLSAVAVERHAG